MRSQESLKELRYLRALERVIDGQSLSAEPDIDHMRRLMQAMNNTHGVLWKALGCTGSREHDPLASDIVERALEIERRVASPTVPLAAYESYEDFRCEPCGWGHLVLYLQWKGLNAPDKTLDPRRLVSVHKGWHTRQHGPSVAIDPAVKSRHHRAQIEANAVDRISRYLKLMAEAGMLEPDNS